MNVKRLVVVLALGCADGIAAPEVEELSRTERAAMFSNATEAFLAAPDVATLKKLVREPGRVGPLMDAYYKIEKLELPEIRPVTRERISIHKGLYIAALVTKSFANVPIVMELTDKGFLVDWESFVAYSEVSWSDLEKGSIPEKPALIRTRMRVSDYFNYGFTEKEYYCVQLKDLKLDKSVYGYMKRDSAVADDIIEGFARMGSPSPFGEEEDVKPGLDFVILRIKAPAVKAGRNQVEITEFINEGWVFFEDHKE